MSSDIRMFDQALTPGLYGDTVRVTRYDNGGLAFIPIRDGREVHEEDLVLDPGQTQALIEHLCTDPEALRAELAERILESNKAWIESAPVALLLILGVSLGMVLATAFFTLIPLLF